MMNMMIMMNMMNMMIMMIMTVMMICLITFSLKVSPLNTVVTEGAVMVGGPRICQVFTSLHLKLISLQLMSRKVSRYLQFIEN